MIDPGLWSSTPFGNKTALEDFWGMESMFHRVLADEIFRRFGKTVRTTPLGDGGRASLLYEHQQELVGMAAAVGIAGPPDLSSFNLSDEADWASFMFLNGNYHRALRTAVGIV